MWVTPHQAAPPSSSSPPSPPSVGPPSCRVDPPGLDEWSGHGKDTGGHVLAAQTHTLTVGEVTHFVCVLLPCGGPVSDTAFPGPVELCSNGWREWSSRGRRCICSCSLPGAPCSPPPRPPQREPRTDAERPTCTRKKRHSTTSYTQRSETHI